MKHSLKIFFKWFYKSRMGWVETEQEKYPRCINDLKIKPYSLELKGKLLSNEEIQRLIDVCDNSRDRALLIFLLESGVRLSELLSMKIDDFKSNKVGAWVTVIALNNGTSTDWLRNGNPNTVHSWWIKEGKQLSDQLKEKML